MVISKDHAYRGTRGGGGRIMHIVEPGGGGGHSQYILAPKRVAGTLGTGTTPKRGGGGC